MYHFSAVEMSVLIAYCLRDVLGRSLKCKSKKCTFKAYTLRSKGSRTEFFTAILPTPSTGPQLNYVVETVSHKSANWR